MIQKLLCSLTALIIFTACNTNSENNDRDSSSNTEKEIEKSATEDLKINELLPLFQIRKTPFTIDEAFETERKEIDFEYHDYLAEIMPYAETMFTSFRLKSSENFHTIAIDYWDNGMFTELITISTDGTIIDHLTIVGAEGTDEENITTKCSFANDTEFSIRSEHYYNESNGEEKRTEIEKKNYKITDEGKIEDL